MFVGFSGETTNDLIKPLNHLTCCGENILLQSGENVLTVQLNLYTLVSCERKHREPSKRSGWDDIIKQHFFSRTVFKDKRSNSSSAVEVFLASVKELRQGSKSSFLKNS